jgi:hypothetical protein
MKLALLEEVKATQQDYEWYPTTQEIIDAFLNHTKTIPKSYSLLDIGAGDGKVLKSFDAAKKASNSGCELFAIEKSRPLLDSLDTDIAILGTDFWEQTLVDKKVDVIFTNPPYSEFAQWSEKVIREANSGRVYLVVPQRWKESVIIQEAIKARQAEATVIDSFDFLNSEDRQARAKVDLVYINLSAKDDGYGRYRRFDADDELAVDPFELWASDHYNLKSGHIGESSLNDYEKREKQKQEFGVKLDQQLVNGKNLIEAMCELYIADLDKLIQTYKSVSEMDADLMRELDVSVSSVLKSLKVRIQGLKDLYWKQLFDRYEPITSRLTNKSRDNLLSTLRGKTHIDFTASNAYAVTLWAIKNANSYIDSQLVKVFEEMLDKANIVVYKSNQRVFGENTYRYSRYEFLKKVSHVKLEYRIVIENMGGIDSDRWDNRNGLSRTAYDFLGDILTIANNLGFVKADSVSRHYFESGSKEVFIYRDPIKGEYKTLMEVRAYKKGTIHIKFASEFMLALNVEVGRLKGWIHSAQQAAEELGEDLEAVKAVFKSQYQMLPNAGTELLLLGKSAD